MPWRKLLKDDPVPWLLERSDPAVRAMTLRVLLGRNQRDPELRAIVDRQRLSDLNVSATTVANAMKTAGWTSPGRRALARR